MDTIKKLASYRTALEKYLRQKRVFETEEADGKTHRKPFEGALPLPQQFEMSPDDIYAAKIRAELIKAKVGMPKRKI